MIVHVFTAERYHLVPIIAKGFVSVYKYDAQHRILLIGSKNINRLLYDELFHDVGFSDYHYVLSEKELFTQLKENKKYPILFHAGSYRHFMIAFAAGCHCVNWVCWGAGASIHDNMKSKLIAPFKSWIYRRFSSIITLLEDDRVSIIHDFKVSSDRVQTIPYASAGDHSMREKLCLKYLLENKEESSEKPLVLLGNNPSNMSYYVQLLSLLSSFSGKIRVHCMMNYSVKKNEEYSNFIQYGNKLFGEDFRSDEEFYPNVEDYVNYMNSCNVYICGFPDQSGLGALTTVLQLGKKVYITGKNYNWASRDCGAIVFNIRDIDDFDDFVKPLDEDQKSHNFEAVKNFRARSPKLWQEYLHQLDTAAQD